MRNNSYISVLLLFLGSTYTGAQEGTQSQYWSHSSLRYLNEVSLVEPGGSKGSFGHQVGFIYSHFKLNTYNEPSSSIRHSESTLASAGLSYMHGTPIPVDIGFTIEQLAIDNSTYKAAAIIQGTLYESLNRPSLSARIYHSEIIGGNESFQASNNGIEWVASYSPIRLIKTYGTYRLSFHETYLASTPNPDGVALWTESNTEGSKHRTTHQTWVVGAQSNLLSFGFRLGGEYDIHTSSPELKQSVKVKLTTIW